MKINSPIFPNSVLKPFLTCVDYTVSRETFNLMLDEESELLITTPQPKKNDLYKYYQSDEYISHTDSSKTFVDKIYQSVKKIALQKKVKLVKEVLINPTDNIKLLDVGCGTGEFLLYCKNSNIKVVGVEPNPKANSKAKSKVDCQIYLDILDLNNHLKFDVITLWHVLEHIPNLNEYISKLKSLLNENGVLIIAVPNYKSYDAKYYKQFWAAYDVPRHLWHFTKKSISLLFKKVDLNVIKILPMRFDSFYVSLLSEKYKTGKSNLFKAFFIGLLSNLSAINTKEYSSHIYLLKKGK